MAATGIRLSKRQFGFQSGRSTHDTLRLLQERLVAAVDKGCMAVSMSLDVRNAFNTIGWEIVRKALIRIGFRSHVQWILNSYQSAQSLYLYDDSMGDLMTTGDILRVPRGSKFGGFRAMRRTTRITHSNAARRLGTTVSV